VETITLAQLFVIGGIIALAVYYFADSRSKSRWLKQLERQLEVQRKELREWQNKALTRSGSTPLDKVKAMANLSKSHEITPKVITRQQLEYRDADPMQTPITIHANDVSYQRVAKTVEKVAEIIAAHK
jgi:hypothetical protein